MRNPIIRNWKLRGILFGAIGIYMALHLAYAGKYPAPSTTGQDFSTDEFEEGYILYGDICDSWVLIPGMSLWNRGLLAFIYFLALMYVFLGVSIISDLFMGSIEEITSKKHMITFRDAGGMTVQQEGKVWNPTVANLSLMALGSSAPEILLSVIETVGSLDSEPGALGPSTIVGSAAFNLLVISGISIMCVEGAPKKIDDVGVFAVTAISSMFAYFWLLIILVFSSEDVIKLWEAIITFLFFFVLLGLSYGADRYRAKKKKQEEEALGSKALGEPKKYTTDEFYKLVRMSNDPERIKGRKDEKVESEDKIALNVFIRNAFGKNKLEDVTPDDIHAMDSHKSVVGERLKYRGMGARALAGHKIPVKISGDPDKKTETQKIKSKIACFSTPTVHCLENELKAVIEVHRSEANQEESFKVGIKTVELTGENSATPGEDFVHFDEVVEFKRGDLLVRRAIEIIDDESIEPDEDFLVILYDPSSGKQLPGADTTCTVTIIDDDKAGVIEFENKAQAVSAEHNGATLRIVRKNGCVGDITCRWKTIEMEGEEEARNGVHFWMDEGTITFRNQEMEKVIDMKIIETGTLTREEQFRVALYIEEGEDNYLGKRLHCVCTILSSEQFKQKVGRLEQMLKLAIESKTISYGDQFKRAIMLSAEVDENGVVDDVTTCEALTHFLTVGWKLAFAFVPPAHYGGGWPAFFVALCFIGFITAIVGEFATLLGCAIGMSVGVTAITLVAMGTSLPDTFASKRAAQESEFADAAVGNVTGSNSVNVFLGLGLPYLIACSYYKSKGEDYDMPAGDLAFSVIVFLVCSALCLGLLVIRRAVVGGELGGGSTGKYISAAFSILLWVVFIVLVSLKFEGII